MEPLSLVASASALGFASVKTVKGLYDLRKRYKTAGTMITSISSECTVLHIALTQIQKLALTDSFYDRLASQPDLKDSFELALLSCTQTFSALEEEICELSPKPEQKDNQFQRLRYLWNEETMREILQQLRGQQNAINLLLTAIQTEKISEIHQLLLSGNIVLQRLAERSDDLWASHRKPNDDAQSIFTFSETLRSDSKFSFEAELRSSNVYRRVSTANRRAREEGKVPETFANGDLIDLGIDAKADMPVDQPYLDELRRNMATLTLPYDIIDSSVTDGDSSRRNTLTNEGGQSDQTNLHTPTSQEEGEQSDEPQINGLRLLEYYKTRAKDRMPCIQRLPSSAPLPAGWVLRTSPTGRAYYIDLIERYLFYAPPVKISNDDIHRALPTGWKRVETDYGRIIWVHSATGFVSFKHPYDNMKLFGYDFLNDWPFGRNGERRGTMKVYPRAFDFVGDTDGACQMTEEAFRNSSWVC